MFSPSLFSDGKSRWLTESRKVNFYQESKEGTSQPKFLAPSPWLNHCHGMPKSTLSLLQPQRSEAGHDSLVYAHGPCLCLFASISLWHLCFPASLNLSEVCQPPLLVHLHATNSTLNIDRTCCLGKSPKLTQLNSHNDFRILCCVKSNPGN